MALTVEATIFEHLERYSECISAGQSAIRLSDGKYPWMHFRVGSCYFDSKNWSLAATSFRLAAEADKADAASAYNLGLSLLNQGYNSDARQWFREALNRKPDDELRVKILEVLK
jgi:tetratricopeptide (TPR) repeat protein